MGFDVNVIKYLLSCYNGGVSFKNTATLGRQWLLPSEREIDRTLTLFGIKKSRPTNGESDGYCDSFLNILGAQSIQSIDASTYEGATIIHDMNKPINHELHNRFTATIDAGSLEHIYNFTQAVSNCMNMTKVGGHFLGIHPANNQMGHGFYQFSPELFFRIFSKINGFELKEMLIYESFPTTKWYRVLDPNEVMERVILLNKRVTFLAVKALKIESVNVYENSIQQSDYASTWARGDVHDDKDENPNAQIILKNRLKSALPLPMKKIYRSIRGVLLDLWASYGSSRNTSRIKMGFNRDYYKKVIIKNGIFTDE